jgi:hypothetical protein
MSKKYNLTIGFDGVALIDHKMDMVDLSIALTGCNELLDYVNKELNGSDVKLKIQVKSDFQKGSFNILVELTQTISGFLHNHDIKNILEIIGLVGGISGVSLIELYRLIKNKKIIKEEESNGKVVIYLDDQTKIAIPKEVAKLNRLSIVKKSVAVMLTPLQKQGVEEFYSKISDKKEQVISHTEIDTFAFTEEVDEKEDKILDTSINTMICEIIGITFEEDLKWRLQDNQNKFYAKVLDKNFLLKMDNREVGFKKGDLLKAKIEVKTYKINTNLKKEYTVQEVIEVLPPLSNGNLF